ncbi:MAG: ferrous iron transport protein A [Chloroflexi bacterium]|nr:ferrous iron transport protein A [Chloroflexota bacterium]
MNTQSFPLTMAAQGERVRLLRVNAGEALSSRLSAMGLTPGVEFSVIQDSGGPLLLGVRDSRLAVGRGMAQKIFVELISGDFV